MLQRWENSVLKVWTALLLTGCLVVSDLTGATHEVGPGKTFAEIRNVPWESLQAGDTVLIHWRATPYLDKWVICRQGTAVAPITVRGVVGPEGELPMIEGSGAITRTQLNYWNQNRGIIKIGGANTPADTMPRHIVIENLEIAGGRSPFTFTPFSGGVQSYTAFAAGIYIEKGENITIRNCVLRNCANGLFVGSGDDIISTNILVERCYIYDNGMEGDPLPHNTYTAALGMTFQHNRFGPMRDGCVTGNVKDRSAGFVFRYNWIETLDRPLDLVDAEDSWILRAAPSYRKTFVYGNVIVANDGPGTRQICHYGGDSGVPAEYRKGKLYFFNNTIVSRKVLPTTLVRMSTSDEHCDFRNNIVHLTTNATLFLLDSGIGHLNLSHNWFKSSCGSCFGTSSGAVVNDGTSIGGTSPGFIDEAGGDYRLTPSSIAIGAGTAFHPDVLPAHDLLSQYVLHRQSIVRPVVGTVDLGAFESIYDMVAPLISTQPADKNAFHGQTVSFTVAATGTAPFAFQWFFEAEPLANATNNILKFIAKPEDAGLYSVTVSNAAGVATSSNASLLVEADIGKPGVTITFPKAGVVYTTVVTNYILRINGKATDKVRVEDVVYSINGGVWQEAQLNTNSTSVNWSADATLVPGANTLSVKSKDFAGNESNPLTIKFYYNVPDELAFGIEGDGEVKPTVATIGTPTNGATLLVGRNYRMTAFVGPGTNWILTNWTASWTGSDEDVLETNNLILNFIMRSNMVISANFITNPLMRFGGIYNGLFSENAAGIRPASAGYANMKVTPKFGVTGKLLLDGDPISFSGKLRLDGTFEKIVSRASRGKSNLLLNLVMDFESASDTIGGTVSDGVWTSELLAHRATWTTNLGETAAEFARAYTMALPGFASNDEGPGGMGSFTVTVDVLGRIKMTGHTSDGCLVSQSTTLSKAGAWPLFVQMYPTKDQFVTNGLKIKTNVVYNGELFASLNFVANEPASSENLAPLGDVTWMKTRWTNFYWTNGFTNSVAVASSRHVPPSIPATNRIYQLTNAFITMAEGNLEESFVNNLFLKTNNVAQVSPPATNQLKATLTAKSGLITGTFLHPNNTNAVTKWRAVLLQDHNAGHGAFVGTNAGGIVTIEARQD